MRDCEVNSSAVGPDLDVFQVDLVWNVRSDVEETGVLPCGVGGLRSWGAGDLEGGGGDVNVMAVGPRRVLHLECDLVFLAEGSTIRAYCRD